MWASRLLLARTSWPPFVGGYKKVIAVLATAAMPLLLSALQLQPVRLQSADDCKIRPLHPPFESSLDRSMGGEKCRRTCLEPHSPFGDKLNLIPSYISLQNGSSVLKRVKASTTRSSPGCWSGAEDASKLQRREVHRTRAEHDDDEHDDAYTATRYSCC